MLCACVRACVRVCMRACCVCVWKVKHTTVQIETLNPRKNKHCPGRIRIKSSYWHWSEGFKAHRKLKVRTTGHQHIGTAVYETELLIPERGGWKETRGNVVVPYGRVWVCVHVHIQYMVMVCVWIFVWEAMYVRACVRACQEGGERVQDWLSLARG